MPCPLFEPLRRVEQTADHAPRLPLLFEFEGVCHAGEAKIEAEHRFTYCNRGYAKGYCKSFPPDLAVSAVRMTVTGHTPRALTVLVVEEQDHWPGACTRVDFLRAERRLEPEISDPCRRAQVYQFCLSYLDKTK